MFAHTHRLATVAALLSFAAVGRLTLADELCDERIASLNGPDKAVWLSYLKRSRELAHVDREALASELQAQTLKQAKKAPDGSDFKLSHKPGDAWFESDEAAQLTRVVISYQTPSGGWSKHISYRDGPRAPGTQWTSQSQPGKPPHYQATFDNRATTEQLILLSSVTNQTVVGDSQAAFSKGLDFVLNAQFPNGGWPQVYPLEGGYHDNITYNDDAQVHILELLLSIENDPKRFAFLSNEQRQAAQRALQRGVSCLVQTQFMQGSQRTAWCAQHDALTLKPASARAMEPASLSGSESAHILQFLMRLKEPTPEVVECIEAGLKWLEKVKIVGLERVKVDGKTTFRAAAESKEVFWARFYDLESNQPIYPGRDGKIYRSYQELAATNRLGYDYLSTQPGSILTNAQKKWRAKK